MHQKLNLCTCYNVKMKVGTHKNINSLSKQHIRRHHFDFFSFVLCYQKQKTWDGSLTRTRCHQSYLTLSSLLDSCKKRSPNLWLHCRLCKQLLHCTQTCRCQSNCFIVDAYHKKTLMMELSHVCGKSYYIILPVATFD